MKLLFVTDNGFSSKGEGFYYSGANIQHYSTVTKHFDDIVFIARNSMYEPSSNKINYKYKTYLVNSITSGREFFKKYIELNNILEKEIKDADAVMCFGLNGYFAYKKAKKYDKAVIVYIGGCVYDTLKNMDSNFKKNLAFLMKRLISDMVKNADYVHYVDEYLLEKYPTNGKNLICPSVRIEVKTDVLTDRLEKITSKKPKILLGIIGYTHNKIKGIDTIIRALPLLGKDYKLQIVGRGDHTWLEDIAKDLGVEDQIEFLGILEGRERIFKWIDTIDIYLQPSLTEGMPRATLEAMSRACPVITTSVGGLKNIVKENYRIEKNDYLELSKKIKKISSNKEIMVEAAKFNFKTAERYDINVLDKKRNSFYQFIQKSI